MAMDCTLCGPAASSFQAVTRATEEQLGSSFLSLFRAGDNFQRGAVDLFFSLVRFDLLNPNRAARLGSDLLQQTAGAAAQTVQAAAQAAPGWGTSPQA